MYAQFERFELQITMAQAQGANHQGCCDDDVAALVADKRIARQLAKLDPEKVRAELKDYGAWDAEELADHTQNLHRLVWIAAGNIVEGNT